jgi:hypothetical protein
VPPDSWDYKCEPPLPATTKVCSSKNKSDLWQGMRNISGWTKSSAWVHLLSLHFQEVCSWGGKVLLTAIKMVVFLFVQQNPICGKKSLREAF